MKTFFKIIGLCLLPFVSFSQITTQEATLSDQDKEAIRELLKEHIKQKAAIVVQNACNCIDSISIKNRKAEDTAVEIKACIDRQVPVFQGLVKMLSSKDTILIVTDQNSKEYKRHYYAMERMLMEECPAIKKAIGANNVERENSISKNPQARAEYRKGQEFSAIEDYKKALPFYKKAVKIDPKFAFAWDNLGVCYRNLGKLDKAIDAYKKSIEADPKGTLPWQNLAIAYSYKKEYSKAIGAYLKLAELSPKNPEVYYGIGLVYCQDMKEYEKSLENMCKAYIIYTEQNSPYRADAEKIIGFNYQKMKEQGKEARFYEILKSYKLMSD